MKALHMNVCVVPELNAMFHQKHVRVGPLQLVVASKAIEFIHLLNPDGTRGQTMMKPLSFSGCIKQDLCVWDKSL